MFSKLIKEKILHEIYRHSLKLSFLLIKIPTPYGWMTSYLYSGGLSYALGRPSESNILKFFRPRIRWTVVDVGANVGWFTLIASKKVGFQGTVVAIEPEPKNFSLLCKNIRDNKLTNVIPLRIALSDKDNHEQLAISSSPAGHSIMSNSNRKMIVKARKLDSLLKELNIKKINLLKIDVEDAELKVLKGGKNTLKKGTRLIVESFQPDIVQKYLKSLDYEIKNIDNSNFFACKNG